MTLDWKAFFKPTIAKVVLFLVLMIGLNFLTTFMVGIYDAYLLVGVPLAFWPVGSGFGIVGSYPFGSIGLYLGIVTGMFSWLDFIVDAIFWYVVASGIVFMYKSIKDK